MENSIFHQKMKDLKQKLNSINEDIFEIQKNQKKKKNRYSSREKRTSAMIINSNNYKINNKEKSINIEQPLYSVPNNELLYNLTIDTPNVTPNKKIFFNKNFYEKLDNFKVRKKLDSDLVDENEQENDLETYNDKKLKNKYTYSNIINADDEISFRQNKDDNFKLLNKFNNAINSSRNPISLRNNKKSIPFSINTLNKELNIEQNKIKGIYNHKFNDNIMINNNNTICITCDNNKTIQRDRKSNRKKLVPLTQKTNLKSNVFNLYSIISPKSKNLLNSKTVYFETNINNKKNKNKLINLSNNNNELIRNETETQMQYHRDEAITSSNTEKYFSDKSSKIKHIIKNSINNKNYDSNKETIDIKKKKNVFNNYQNKKKFNSISFNKMILNNANTLINDKSNKLIKIQNKIFNLNGNFKNSHGTFDKEKFIIKINKQLIKKNKNHSNYKSSNLSERNIVHTDTEKRESEISADLANKLNRNIIESKITNNFILKLIKLYYESTGNNINKDNDLNSTLNILYNWIENINKKFYYENKKVNEELQYKMIRQKIMNHYQLKNKNELKSFLTKILGSDV